MNAGYVAAWLTLSCIILLATGWRKQLLDDLPAAHAVMFAALLLTSVAAAHKLPPESGLGPLSWTLTPYAVTGLMVSIQLGSIAGQRRRLYAVVSMLLAGAVWIWFRKLYAADPLFDLWNAALDGPLAAGLLAAMLSGRFREQFIAAAGASLLAEWQGGYGISLFSWLDGLAAAITAARGITAAGIIIRNAIARLRLPSSGGIE